MSDDKKYWVWLSSLPQIGSRKAMKLLERFKDVENIWKASELELRTVTMLSQQNISSLLDRKYREDAESHLHNILQSGIRIININDPSYPYYLKNIYDPPIALYVKGNINNEDKHIAIVGSRKATAYGLRTAETIAFELAECGITVVSGMASGIDSYAHSGALKAGGQTIAVLGCGPDIVYPRENKRLAEKIANSGAIVSEYLPGYPPMPGNFPARNRIISGISLGVVIVEAGERSGSLITANFALEQGRDVFAVPGNVSSSNSRGTNMLIKDGAKIVTDINDILEELKVFKTTNNINNAVEEYQRSTAVEALFKNLDKDEQSVARCLAGESLHIDLLAQRSGLAINVINSILVMMEMKGVIEQEAGKIFKLKL